MQASYVLSLFMMMVAMCGVQSAISQVGKNLQSNGITDDSSASVRDVDDLTANEHHWYRRRIYRRLGEWFFSHFFLKLWIFSGAKSNQFTYFSPPIDRLSENLIFLVVFKWHRVIETFYHMNYLLQIANCKLIMSINTFVLLLK